MPSINSFMLHFIMHKTVLSEGCLLPIASYGSSATTKLFPWQPTGTKHLTSNPFINTTAYQAPDTITSVNCNKYFTWTRSLKTYTPAIVNPRSSWHDKFATYGTGRILFFGIFTKMKTMVVAAMMMMMCILVIGKIWYWKLAFIAYQFWLTFFQFFFVLLTRVKETKVSAVAKNWMKVITW